MEELYIHIEHIIPRTPKDNRDVGQGLDYGNMVAACRGFARSSEKGPHTKENLTCDAHKENDEFRKINPTKADTLASIFYSLDGEIKSDDPDVWFDLNNLLNLNCSSSPLKAERKAALDALISSLSDVENRLEVCQLYLKEFTSETEKKRHMLGY